MAGNLIDKGTAPLLIGCPFILIRFEDALAAEQAFKNDPYPRPVDYRAHRISLYETEFLALFSSDYKNPINEDEYIILKRAGIRHHSGTLNGRDGLPSQIALYKSFHENFGESSPSFPAPWGSTGNLAKIEELAPA
jgi:hypothetical protein